MYKDEISQLITRSLLEIDTNILINGRPPTMANSEFLTNKEQGDWAEKIIYAAINENLTDYFAVKYGHDGTLAAGDEGFSDFYTEYQNELNDIGKRPDILIFKKTDFPTADDVTITNQEHVSKAVAAIEVRSSAFLSEHYAAYMRERQQQAIDKCNEARNRIIGTPLGEILRSKNETIYNLIFNANNSTFYDLDFRRQSWSSTQELRDLSELLKEIKENIKILHKRDYLSITPKMEDIALVNRWIQKFNVKHYYLQVFFDKAYLISFKKILSLISDAANEGTVFSIEQDVKNQGKTTIKINVQIGEEVIGRIDEPSLIAEKKILERGRLLFFVKFDGGKGYLNNDTFTREVINA